MIDAIVPLALQDAVSIPIRANAMRIFLASYIPRSDRLSISFTLFPFLAA